MGENEALYDECMETLKNFLGGELDYPDAVIKLAIKKCNMQLEEAMCMLTDEY